MIKIKEINKSQDIGHFISFTRQVYKNYPTYVPPLVQQTKLFLSGKHPFFKHCEHKLFIALKDGEIVSTLAAFYDRNLVSHYGEEIGLIGYCEALPNCDEAVSAILMHGERFLIEKGSKTIWAPFNGNIMFGVSLLAEPYDEDPLFLMPYNPPYYHSYYRKNGYRKFKDIIAFTIDLLDNRLQRKISYISRQAQRSPIKIRPIKLDCFREEISRFAKIYSDTFKKHWGFVPQSEDEIYEMFEPFRVAVEKDFVLFAEHNDNIVGFVLCVPDYNSVIKSIDGNLEFFNIFKFFRLKKRIRKARLIAIGVSEEYRGQNIAPLLIANSFNAMINKGYTTVEYSWVLAENIPSRNVISKFYGRAYKYYNVYKKKLNVN